MTEDLSQDKEEATRGNMVSQVSFLPWREHYIVFSEYEKRQIHVFWNK